MAETTPDPLDGYRGRPAQEWDALEAEAIAFRSLATDPDDIAALRSIIRSDEIIRLLEDDSNALTRLMTHAYKVRKDATDRWLETADPRSDEALGAHLDGRAAALVISWVEEQLEIGKQASLQMEAEGYE